MNSLSNSLRALTLKTPKRLLLGFADSEGAPHRGDGKSSLWDLCIIFKHVVDADTFEIIEDCFHVCHVSLPKYLTRNMVKTKLKHHFSIVQHIREEHECQDVCIGFWNAGHDQSVLRYYDVGGFWALDLLKCARHHTGGLHESYNLGALCRKFNIETPESIHTGLGDTLRMIHLLPKLGISEPKKMSAFVKRTTDQKPNHVEENVGRGNPRATEKNASGGSPGSPVSQKKTCGRGAPRTTQGEANGPRSGRLARAWARARQHRSPGTGPPGGKQGPAGLHGQYVEGHAESL